MVVKDNPNLYWLRWIAILPASIATYLLGYAATMIFGYVVRYFSDHDGFQWLNHIMFPLIASGVAGYYYIIVGTDLAPYHKKIVATVLTTIMFIYLILCCIWVFDQKDWRTGIEVIGTVVGIIKSFKDVKEPTPKAIEPYEEYR